MSLSRRDFLKIMGGTTAALAFPGVILQGCRKALEKASARTNVIWIQAQSCSGCSVSLLNNLDPGIATVITEYISLNYHQTLMAGTGGNAVDVLDQAVKKQRKDFVLIVEGSIPKYDGHYLTIGSVGGRHVPGREWIEKLGNNAAAIVAVGTCATAGGIPAALPQAGPQKGKNPTDAVSLHEILPGKKIINIGGCPPHPDWIVGTLLHVLLKGEIPPLDEQNRPLMYFGKTVHEQCHLLKDYHRGKFAEEWGDSEGCLYKLGCLGMDSNCDIPTRKWVGGINSCTGSGAGCIGCTEDVFPDYGTRGLFKHLNASVDEINKIENADIREAVLKLKRNGGSING
ncbi:MAG: hydrogenase small subunit [Leptospirales bacterium]|nr:hydrogenase small subunit [Leptospirales bacterium]